MLSNTHVICPVSNKITHRVNRIQWGIANSFITFDEAVLHVITQSDFLSWNLQNFIYLMGLMTINCMKISFVLMFFCCISFFLWYKKCLSSQLSFSKQRENKFIYIYYFRLIYCIYFGNFANYNLFMKEVCPYCYFFGNFVDG